MQGMAFDRDGGQVKLRCPACGAEFGLDEGTRAAELLELDRAALAFGLDWPLVAEYLDCFRFRRDGALALKKRLRLAREVWAMWSACRFDYGGESYRVRLEDLKEALAQMGNKELLGLKNHNYLKQILRAAAAMTLKRKEKERLAWEERARGGAREGKPGESDSPKSKVQGPKSKEGGEEEGPPQDPEWRTEFRRLNQAVIRARTPEEKAAAQKAYKEFMQRGRTC
jgi:hypothetical protein